jgi:hypothetical protein
MFSFRAILDFFIARRGLADECPRAQINLQQAGDGKILAWAPAISFQFRGAPDADP